MTGLRGRYRNGETTPPRRPRRQPSIPTWALPPCRQPPAESKCAPLPESVQLSTGGTQWAMEADPPVVTRCRSPPWVPNLGCLQHPKPLANSTQEPRWPRMPSCRPWVLSHPPPLQPPPRHPPATQFLFPFPARLGSSSPRQLATPRAALGRRPKGLDLLRFVRYSRPHRTGVQPGMPLPNAPPQLPAASSSLGLGCAPSLSCIHGESGPSSTGAELRPCWVTSVPGRPRRRCRRWRGRMSPGVGGLRGQDGPWR